MWFSGVWFLWVFAFFLSVVLSWCLLVFVGGFGGFRVCRGCFGVFRVIFGARGAAGICTHMIEFLLHSGLPGRAFL